MAANDSVVQVLEEVAGLINKVNKDIGSGVKEHDLPAHIDIGVGSIINAILFGYRFSATPVGPDEHAQHCLTDYVENRLGRRRRISRPEASPNRLRQRRRRSSLSSNDGQVQPARQDTCLQAKSRTSQDNDGPFTSVLPKAGRATHGGYRSGERCAANRLLGGVPQREASTRQRRWTAQLPV